MDIGPSRRRTQHYAWTLLAACAFLFAGCSREAPPPLPPMAEVSVLKVEPRDTPVTFEYIAQTRARRRSTSSRGSAASSTSSSIRKARSSRKARSCSRWTASHSSPSSTPPGGVEQGQGRQRHRAGQPEAGQAARGSERPVAEDLDDATGNADTTAASVAQAQANVDTARLNLSYTTIASPLRGSRRPRSRRKGPT